MSNYKHHTVVDFFTKWQKALKKLWASRPRIVSTAPVFVTGFPGQYLERRTDGFDCEYMIPITWVLPEEDDEQLLDVVEECINRDLRYKITTFGSLDEYSAFFNMASKYIPGLKQDNPCRVGLEEFNKGFAENFTIIQIALQPLQTPANDIGDVSRNFSALLYEVQTQNYHLIDGSIYTHGGRWHLNNFRIEQENFIPEWVKTDEA